MSTLPRTIVEALLIGASGLGLGLLGNSLSPVGLRIDRDYFPRAGNTVETPPATGTPPAVAPVPAPTPAPAHTPGTETANANANADADSAASAIEQQALARLAARGLSAIRFDEARALYEDPLYAAGGLLFIDARHDEDYVAGHVPLALQFDHYHAERYLDAVMQAAPGTSRIVVYCNGGACEDSEFAATTLQDFLPEPSRICVYVGGIEEWRARGMPLETGETP